MSRNVLILGVFVLCILAWSSLGFAGQQQSVKEKPVALEWVMGIVKAVDLDKKSIEISYYDFENDKNALVTVYVNKDTEYIGANSLKDINPGDDIEVSYIYKDDGSRVAEAVITAKFSSQEDSES